MFIFVFVSICFGKLNPDRHLSNHFEENTVSLYQQGSLGLKTGRELVIGNRKFRCDLNSKEGSRNDQDTQAMDQGRAIIAGLDGICVNNDQSTLCIGEHISVGAAEFQHKSDQLREGFVVSKYISTQGDQIEVSCMCDQSPLSDVLRPTCRIGEILPQGRIVEIDVNKKTVDVYQEKLTGDQIVRLGWAETDCVSGVELVRNFQVASSSMSFDSRVCCLNPKNPWNLLTPLKGLCAQGVWMDRVFEYCHGEGLFFVKSTPTVTGRTQGERLRITKETLEFSFSSKTLHSSMSGSSCQPVTSSYKIRVGENEYEGQGGAFNPSTGLVAGHLIVDPENMYGCEDWAEYDYKESWIAVVLRGECMFQTKAQIAQKAGAAAVIILNTKGRGMVRWMAAVSSEKFPDIPAILIDRGAELLEGGNAVIQKEGRSEEVNIDVEFFCEPRWREQPWNCEPGKEVSIRSGIENERFGIVETHLGGGLMTVRMLNDEKGVYEDDFETIPSALVYGDSEWSCAGNDLLSISSLEIEECEGTLFLHSSLLCADPRFMEIPKSTKNIKCEALD